MRLNYVQALFMLGFSILLAACGSGSGGDSGSPPTSTAQTYTASATAGEILTYTLDTQNKTYSYQITHSAYGLDSTPRSGTLVLNPDGSYSPSNDPSTRVHALQNGLLVGTIHLTLSNGPHIVPIFGISQPISSQPDLEGVYNFVGIQCPAQTFGVYTGCGSFYGTIKVDKAGNYIACPAANVTNGTGTCSPLSTGTLGSLGNGIWQVMRTGQPSTNKNYLLAFAAPNGQKVMILDLNDPASQNDPGGYGYGFIMLSTQTGYVQNLVDGTWVFQNNYGTAGSLVVAGQQITSSLLPQNPITAKFDSPWTGLAFTGNGVALLAGTGVYAYVNLSSSPYPGYLELGMKK